MAAPCEADDEGDAKQRNQPVQARHEWLQVSQQYEQREETGNHEAHHRRATKLRFRQNQPEGTVGVLSGLLQFRGEE
jgi:hypothetical protein